MVAVTVISDQDRNRKLERSFPLDWWALLRGLIAFTVTLITLLASAWLGGNLRQQHTAKPSEAAHVEAQRPLPMVQPETLAAPAPPSARPVRHPEEPLEPIALFPHSDGIEVLSSEELAAISQAHRARPAP